VINILHFRPTIKLTVGSGMQIKCRSEYMLVFELFFIFVQCNGDGFLDVINFYQNVLNRWSENF